MLALGLRERAHRFEERGDADLFFGGDLKEGGGGKRIVGPEPLDLFCGPFKVDFVQGDDERFVFHRVVVGGKFGAQHLEVVNGVAPFEAGDVDDVDKGRRAFNVFEEGDPEAFVFVGVFDDPGNVGDEDAGKVVELDIA